MTRSIACGHGKNCQFIQKLNLVIDIDDHKIGHTAVSTKKNPTKMAGVSLLKNKQLIRGRNSSLHPPL